MDFDCFASVSVDPLDPRQVLSDVLEGSLDILKEAQKLAPDNEIIKNTLVVREFLGTDTRKILGDKYNQDRFHQGEPGDAIRKLGSELEKSLYQWIIEQSEKGESYMDYTFCMGIVRHIASAMNLIFYEGYSSEQAVRSVYLRNYLTP